MEKQVEINIAKDFSTVLGGRWISLGENSGEEFYENFLFPRFKEALSKGVKLVIYLDGTKGYPSSFVDQSFGELARKEGVELVRKTLEFKTQIFQWVVDFINKEIWDKTK